MKEVKFSTLLERNEYLFKKYSDELCCINEKLSNRKVYYKTKKDFKSAKAHQKHLKFRLKLICKQISL